MIAQTVPASLPAVQVSAASAPEYGVVWLDAHPWRSAIAAPVAGGDACGAAADAFEDFQDIESELIKRGTLSQKDIRWPLVGEIAARLMARQSKDLRLLHALILALPSRAEQSGLSAALALTAQFVTLWGKACHPRTRLKNRVAERIVASLDDLMQREGKALIDPLERGAAQMAARQCAEAFAEILPDLGLAVAAIASRLSQTAARSDAPVPVPPRSESVAAPAKQASLAPPLAVPRSDALRLDVDNERALKQTIATVADFLFQLDVAHPLSYRLRRYGTWFRLDTPPPIKSGARTVLPPVSEESLERYRAAVERGQTDPDITQKLERACHLQPFWLEGQWLACQLARIAGRSHAAEAIAEEARGFFQRMPDVATLSFADGSPFAPPEVGAWLKFSRAVGAEQAGGVSEDGEAAASAASPEARSAFAATRALVKAGEVPKALAELDGARAQAKGLRAKTFWEVATLELLSELGLQAHAAAQSERLQASLVAMSVGEWEPDLIRRLGRVGKGRG